MVGGIFCDLEMAFALTIKSYYPSPNFTVQKEKLCDVIHISETGIKGS
jgi:hypothetical protein